MPTASPLFSSTAGQTNWLVPDPAEPGAQLQLRHDSAFESQSSSTASNTLADMARGPGAPFAHLADTTTAAAGKSVATARASELNLDAEGLVHHPKVQNGIHEKRHIERGDMPQVNGIVIHQTGASTAASTFSSYANPGANGAHFLIDKDGTIYQTASLHKATNHVGPLLSRCEAEGKCDPSGSNVKQMHRNEKAKNPGERYPSNQDAIGIELVGSYHRAKNLTASTDPQGQRTVTLQTENGKTIVYKHVSDDAFAAMKYEHEKTKDHYIYEPVTQAQNASLQWLTKQLQTEFKVSDTEVFAHPVVSRKNQTEASTAQPHGH